MLLKAGSHGHAVGDLQRKLTALGFSTKGVDSYYGNNTTLAVIAFQKAHGLTADGIAGDMTLSKIESVYNGNVVSTTATTTSSKIIPQSSSSIVTSGKGLFSKMIELDNNKKLMIGAALLGMVGVFVTIMNKQK